MKTKPFADVIRQAIIDSDLSRYAISKRSGVPESVLSRFMAGERSISLETAEKLSHILGFQLTRVGPQRSNG